MHPCSAFELTFLLRPKAAHVTKDMNKKGSESLPNVHHLPWPELMSREHPHISGKRWYEP